MTQIKQIDPRNVEMARKIILARRSVQGPTEAIMLNDIFLEMVRRGAVGSGMDEVIQAAEELEQEGIIKLIDMIPPLYARARFLPPQA